MIIPASCTTIGEAAFSKCENLKTIHLPAAFADIKDDKNIWWGLSNQVTITVDESNPNFSEEDGVLFNKDKTTLLYCPDSKEEYTVPASVKTISKNAFLSNKQLKSLQIPAGSLTTIKENAFTNTGLNSLVIPHGVTTIESYAFSNCNLHSLSIAATAADIRLHAFLLGSSQPLAMLYIYNPTPWNVDIENEYEFTRYKQACNLFVPAGSSEAYKAHSYWKQYTQITENMPLQLSSYIANFDKGASEVTVSLTFNETWIITCDQPWISVSHASGAVNAPASAGKPNKAATAGSGNSDLVISAEANTSGKTRTAIINVATFGLPAVSFTVTQSGETTGINDLKADKNGFLQLYPNPASSYFALAGITESAQVSVFDISGKKVMEKTVTPNERISAIHLSKGVYTVKANGKTGKLLIN